MQWKYEDMNMYVQSKEYVDTLLVPLVPFTYATNENDEEIKKRAFQAELSDIFMNEIEKQYKGRLLIAPSYTYLSPLVSEKEVERINEWVKQAENSGFEHILFFTFDNGWKKIERKLDASLVWIPAGQVSEIQSPEAQKLIQSQIEQVMELITSYW